MVNLETNTGRMTGAGVQNNQESTNKYRQPHQPSGVPTKCANWKPGTANGKIGARTFGVQSLRNMACIECMRSTELYLALAGPKVLLLLLP
jgi:hypothetical protein